MPPHVPTTLLEHPSPRTPKKGTMALEQVAFLMNEGVVPSQIIGHINLRLDWAFVLALA
jgi:hypothetical protein